MFDGPSGPGVRAMTSQSLADRLDDRWACRQRTIYGRHGWLVSWMPSTAPLWLARLSCPESPDTAEGLGRTRREAIVAADRALRARIEEDADALDIAYQA
jgi:hypothetical protein